MRVGTFNAHDNPHAVRRALQRGVQLLVVQEHAAAQLEATGWDHVAGPGDLAVYWQPRFLRHVATAWYKAHGGRRFRIGGTPKRGTQLSRFRFVGLDLRGLDLAVLHGHRINRTRGRWRYVPGVQSKARARLWERHDELDRELIAELIDAGCRLIVYGGDLNRKRVRPLHPKAQLLTGEHIDQLWLIDLDDQLRVGESDAVRRLGSDHPLRRSTLFRKD